LLRHPVHVQAIFIFALFSTSSGAASNKPVIHIFYLQTGESERLRHSAAPIGDGRN